MYGSEILHNGREQNNFEKIHLSYLKKHACCKKKTPTLAIRRHWSFPSFAETTSANPEILGSSYSFTRLPHLKKTYNCLLGLDSIEIENWTKHAKTLLFNLNLGSF